MATSQKNFTKIGIFYDGNFFLHVSNYYQYYHARKSRISISGLHDFIRHRVAPRPSRMGAAMEIRPSSSSWLSRHQPCWRTVAIAPRKASSSCRV